jgi:hypothetical protein
MVLVAVRALEALAAGRSTRALGGRVMLGAIGEAAENVDLG